MDKPTPAAPLTREEAERLLPTALAEVEALNRSLDDMFDQQRKAEALVREIRGQYEAKRKCRDARADHLARVQWHADEGQPVVRLCRPMICFVAGRRGNFPLILVSAKPTIIVARTRGTQQLQEFKFRAGKPRRDDPEIANLADILAGRYVLAPAAPYPGDIATEETP